jgi:hypothetical protein
LRFLRFGESIKRTYELTSGSSSSQPETFIFPNRQFCEPITRNLDYIDDSDLLMETPITIRPLAVKTVQVVVNRIGKGKPKFSFGDEE